jgi:hypothetical protein
MKLVPRKIALALVAALAAMPALAQERPGTAGQKQAAPVLVVEDQYGIRMHVQDAVFVRPASGFLSGSKGKTLKELRVFIGAHEVLVSLGDLARLEVSGKPEGDLVPVKVVLRSGASFEGKVERDLEVHGKVQYGQYEIKFERLRTIAVGG